MIRRRRGQEGFTLIELTVSLAAGLIVALGIVGLSRDATQTFHEEMRSSAAEANLRTAVDRLRADLSRAAYMSTSDVITDPMIAKAPGTLNPIPLALTGLARLSSILLNQGGSTPLTPLSTVADNSVNPDMIDIAGNMTSTDQYEVSTIQPPGGAGGCQQINLNASSPSMYRILGLGTPAASAQELINIFQPTPDGTGQFIVRLVDKTGHSQFLLTCAGTPAGVTGNQPFLLIAPQTPVLLGSATGTVGGLNGYGSGSLVNPVHIVRWQLMAATAEPAQYQASPMGGQPLTPTVIDPTKYDLVRSYVDAVSGSVLPSTTEVVAEYAVDLEFAFSVDTGLSNLQPAITTLTFDNVANAPWAPDLIKQPPPVPTVGPSRIRSVRVRLVTRTADADRTLNVPVPNPTGPFMYRYCLVPGGCATPNTTGVLQFARARTVTAEVALSNQSRNYY
jgi:prepilin-type N-terminal cleavage/methylation domain-containing protein